MRSPPWTQCISSSWFKHHTKLDKHMLVFLSDSIFLYCKLHQDIVISKYFSVECNMIDFLCDWVELVIKIPIYCYISNGLSMFCMLSILCNIINSFIMALYSLLHPSSEDGDIAGRNTNDRWYSCKEHNVCCKVSK